jgi:pleiotropic regulator 1
VFRSLKRTHDMFLSDFSHPIEMDEKSLELRKLVKAKSEYGPVMNMPRDIVSNSSRKSELQSQNEEEEEYNNQSESFNNEQQDNHQEESNISDDQLQEQQQAYEAEEMQQEESAGRVKFTTDSIFTPTQGGAGGATGSASGSKALTLFGNNSNTAISAYKRNTISMPKPQWHAPWKLCRVISGHLGWVRCVDVDPSNEWFVTGSGDRIIKIWDLASGTLKLSLTGHISTVRGVCVSSRHPYLFSCGEDKKVLCWDLESNKVCSIFFFSFFN